MNIAEQEARQTYPAEYQYGSREAYLRGRNEPPADAEVEAVAKRLLWNSCKRYDDEYAAKDEEEAWYREGCFPGRQEDYIRQAKELLALARKAVNE
ncbi:hypothetical protein [Bifidobacterium longum]|uniref:hypothetical protein n=1 Tax=Bifidobacterium longum TaxID=216816 RepID=UPI000CB4E1A8|nr:hypothetical protein [Bifidobacterium longum]PKC91885.1 hypothetical protein APC1482_0629 [Bifidobacterium longum]